MDANDRTKERLAQGIKTLMVHKPLDKITVKEIVDQSELTRQTFYRYFQDKYDLVNWYFDKLAQQSIKQMGVSLTLEEGSRIITPTGSSKKLGNRWSLMINSCWRCIARAPWI